MVKWVLGIQTINSSVIYLMKGDTNWMIIATICLVGLEIVLHIDYK